MNEFPVSKYQVEDTACTRVCVCVFVLDLGIINPSTVTYSKFSSCLQKYGTAEDAVFRIFCHFIVPIGDNRRDIAAKNNIPVLYKI